MSETQRDPPNIRPSDRAWGHRYGWGFLTILPTFYAVFAYAMGSLRWEHVLIAIGIAFLGWGPRPIRHLLPLAYPIIIVGFGYEALKQIRPLFVTAERTLGCELRDLELAFFAVGPNTTLADFFSMHPSKLFDVLAALPYGLFIYVIAGYSAYLYFRDIGRLKWFLGSVLVAHLIAFTIWLLVPAAPPWYIRAYGCIIDATVSMNPGALARVDDMLGVPYFQAFYSRGPTPFGALPSMHCALPVIGMLTAAKAATWRTWPLHLLYAASMIVASVYLDHHWLLDGFAGWLVAAISVWITARVMKYTGGQRR